MAVDGDASGRRVVEAPDQVRKDPKVLAAYPAPVPFNYPPLILQEMPGKTDETRLEAADEEDPDPADWWKGEGTDRA